MESIRINIEGLQFSETQDRVKDQIEGMIGVTNVKMSEGQDYVDVDFNDQTSVLEIRNHLQNNGYKILDFD